MIDPDAIRETRRALGRQLAALRDASGLNQHELAPRINYGRSTIASAETGYSQCSRIFWKRCDETLNAGGALVQGYDRLQELIKQHRVEEARRLERQVADTVRQASQWSSHGQARNLVNAVGWPDQGERLVVTSL